MAWETLDEGLTIDQAIHRLTTAFYHGGDAYRVVRESDGEEFCLLELRWMSDNLNAVEIATRDTDRYHLLVCRLPKLNQPGDGRNMENE